MSNKSAQFRAMCIQEYILSGDSPEKTAANLIQALTDNPEKHAKFHLPLATAEGIIRATFERTYDKAGKYVSTLPPTELRNLGKVSPTKPTPSTLEPDLVHAATLSKTDLDEYAEQFGINLNRSMTKANMLIDFEKQLNEKQ